MGTKVEVRTIPLHGLFIHSKQEENLRNTLVYAISSFDFERLSTDELKQVYNIVKGKEK